MDANHNISLTDIGLVVEKLMGSGYISEYSKKDFKHKYVKYLYRIVTIFVDEFVFKIKKKIQGFVTFY
jgi:hypothetical protein